MPAAVHRKHGQVCDTNPVRSPRGVTYLDFVIFYQMLSHGLYQHIKEKPRVLREKKHKNNASLARPHLP